MPSIGSNNKQLEMFFRNLLTKAGFYPQPQGNRELTDIELFEKEKRVNKTSNKIKIFFYGGERLTPQEIQRLNQLHAQQTASTNQTATFTNKTDQSIWTIKDDKK